MNKMTKTQKLQEIAEIMAEYESSPDFMTDCFERLVTERIPEEDISEFIEEEVMNKKTCTQSYVLRMLAKAGHKEVLQFIEPLLSISEWSVKLNSSLALAHLGDERGFKILEYIYLNQSSCEDISQYIPLDWILDGLQEISITQARELEVKLQNTK
jgi:hypothetical protein